MDSIDLQAILAAQTSDRASSSPQAEPEVIAALRRLLQKTFEALGDAVIIVNPQSRTILACSPATELVFGYPPHELAGRNAAVIHVDRAHYEEFGRQILAALDGGGSFRGEFEMRRRDGTVFPTENTVTEIRDDEGKRIAIVSVVRDVSARERAARELQESEERYRRIVELANEGIWVVDLQARTQFVNERMAAMLGYSAKEMKGTSVLDFSFPEDVQLHGERILKNLEGTFGQFDTRFRRRDGSPVYVLASTSPLQNGEGKITGALGLFSDIGDRMKAERDLELANSIIRNSDDAILSLTLDGIIQTWNEGAERLFGYSPAEAIGRPISLTYPPDHQDEFPEILGRLRRGEHIDHFETVRMRKDGSRLDASVTISPVRDRQGRFIGASKIVRDITERKRAERALGFLASASTLLSASLDYNSTLASVARLAVPFLADWCVVYTRDENDVIRRIAMEHADPGELDLPKQIEHNYPLNPDAATGVPNVMRTGEPEFHPYANAEMLAADAADPQALARLTEPLGVQSWMCVPLTIGRGRPAGAISFISTRSGRRYTAADLALARELASRAALAVENARLYGEAQRAIRIRDQFLSIASHELKTPLTTLLGYSELLRREARAGDDRLSPRERRALEAIHQSSVRLNKLIGALLDISRIQDGHLHLDRQPLDFAALIERSLQIQTQFENHKIEYSGPGKPLMIEGDELRLEQVIQNLLQNAIKYSHKGGPVKVRLWEEGEEAVLTVSDSGIGISSTDLPLLFERFYRGDNAEKLHIGGMGIGLYIVREIVSLHGGDVSAASEEGKGSTFTVRLPLLT